MGKEEKTKHLLNMKVRWQPMVFRILAFALCNATVNSWDAEGTLDVMRSIDYFSRLVLVAVLLAVVLLAWNKKVNALRWRLFCLIGLAGAFFGQILPVFRDIVPVHAVALCASLFSGLGMGILLALLIVALSQASWRSLIIEVAFGYLIMTALLFWFNSISAPHTLYLRSLFSLFGALSILIALSDNAPMKVVDTSTRSRLVIEPIISFFIAVTLIGLPLATVFNLLSRYGVAGVNTAQFQLTVLFCSFLFVALATVFVVFRKSIRAHQIYRLAVFLTILDLLILPVFGANSVYPYLLAMVGYMFLVPLLWVLGIQIARSLKTSPVVVCSLLLVSHFINHNAPVAEALDGLITISATPLLYLNLLSLGGVVLVVVAYVWVFNERKLIGLTVVGDSFPESHELIGFEAVEEDIGKQYRLTNRETAVLKLLAKGRSGIRIQEELGISKGTFNFHSANIYQKLGIHSKQELLDFIERSITANR